MAAQTKAVELEDLKKQFDTLRADMKEMAEMISLGASERAEEAKETAVDAATTLAAEAKEKTSHLKADAERAITDNPLAAVALFAGIGYLFGAVSRR
jgi:ElaB/YqjD/DUF883 family membrane-anchored ribosome-binding protein